MGQLCHVPQGSTHDNGSLVDYCYSEMDDGTEISHFLQGIKSTELEAAIIVVWAQPEKYGKSSDATWSNFGQMVMKKGYPMQSISGTQFNLSTLLRLQVNQQNLKWHPLESFCQGHCLDPEEVSTNFWKQWQACRH